MAVYAEFASAKLSLTQNKGTDPSTGKDNKGTVSVNDIRESADDDKCYALAVALAGVLEGTNVRITRTTVEEIGNE